ncbi:hypothetical protein [Sulfitobacter profundi]|uniref:hypothetical protein n=1 Tax=Sulfitobacter profundi TaxID=2679961 RepID=UPI0036DB713E
MSMLKPRATLPLPRDWMRKRLSKLAAQMGDAAETTARNAGIAPGAVDRLIFVGGSSLMEVVEAEMRTRFPHAEGHRGAALTAIVEGLALSAGGGERG